MRANELMRIFQQAVKVFNRQMIFAGLVFFMSLNAAAVSCKQEQPADNLLRRLSQVFERRNYLTLVEDTLLTCGADSLVKDVVILGGKVALECPVAGTVMVCDGELSLRASARVSGDVILVRSSLYSSRSATVGGEVFRTAAAECVSYIDGQLSGSKPRKQLPYQVLLKTNRMGGFGLVGYDRVDGYSLSWGFAVELPEVSALPLFKARVISATTRQAVGFDTELRLPLYHQPLYTLGLGARSLTDTNDRWRLGDLDNAFKAFVAGNDERYYFRREGFSVDLRRNVGRRSHLSLGYLNERCYSLADQSPFTLFGSENFQPNLPVAPGPLHSLYFDGVLDTRGDPFLTLSGLWLRLQAEIAGGALAGKHSFARYDLDFKRWDTFYGIHHTFLWLKLAGADQSLPFQRGYTLGNTLRAYDIFTFSGDRMLMGEASYGLSLPQVPLVEYLLFRWRAELIYETGIAFFRGDPKLGYGDLKKDFGFGFSGDTILGRIGVYLFQNLDTSARSGRRVTVTLNMNVFG
ncbi:MAG: hypothetical protein A3F83_16215 [Candidatus Glassbacteria bacterium RIFCSPLOWO2_12_FULL_58_11]|uniref:Bacterial surface antigen (D15) domain-containing protein n=1 Tax=Candidatus Glassbacteria bacterium RIFCSPLOWO2_12_FULL_58_11 TaxID=1817867 RepID=A0A1F5Z2R3_9BACT|nr:MAG: hypothetical protein A3F83_16215 [Candidatus Glassbacteria bacterium RIFCSPLOWO2_12_FULL_58_11]